MTPVSTLSMSTMLQEQLAKMRSQLSDASLEVSTGRYADVGLALGSQTGHTISLRDQQAQLQAISGANGNVATRLNTVSAAMTSILSTAQDFLNTLTETTASALNSTAAQQAAQEDLQALTGSLNTSVNGEFVFGGTHTQSAPITDYYSSGAANRAAVLTDFQNTFGMAPTDPNTSTITATAMQSFLDTTFAGEFTGTNWATNWSTASDSTVESQISTSQTISSSLSANDVAFQNLSQAYTMMAEFGSSNLGDAAKQGVISTARNLVSQAVQELTNLQAGIGEAKSQLATVDTQLSVQMNVLTTGIQKLEDVDPYAATTQVSALQTQIETSYALTNQLKNLSLVNYLT